MVGAAALVACLLVVGPGPDAGAQEGSTEPSVPELIVPGAPTVTTAPTGAGAAPSSTTAPAPADSGSEVQPSRADDGLAASTKVWIIIAGLVAVALLVLLLTIFYWKRTKPSAVAARSGRGAPDDDVDDPAAPDGAARDETGNGAETTTAAAATGAGDVDTIVDTPRPVGDEPPIDPQRSVFAPPPGDESPEA